MFNVLNARRRANIALWWQGELARGFTKLECGLLGALFASLGLLFVIAVAVAIAGTPG